MQNCIALIFGLLVLVYSPSTAPGATGIFGSYVELTTNGAPTWYGLSETPTASTVDFHGLDLGAFNPATDSLSLTNGQVNTFKSGSGNVTSADIFYQIYLTGGTKPGFSNRTLGFGANSTYEDAGEVNITGSGDQKWETFTASTVDILSGLSNGNYSIEVYARASTNEGERFHNNAPPGSNYIATFTAVPEPSAFLFGGLVCSVLGVNHWRKRRVAER